MGSLPVGSWWPNPLGRPPQGGDISVKSSKMSRVLQGAAGRHEKAPQRMAQVEAVGGRQDQKWCLGPASPAWLSV